MDGVLKNLKINLDEFEKGTSTKIPETVYEPLKRILIDAGNTLDVNRTNKNIEIISEEVINQIKKEEKKMRKQKKQKRSKVGILIVILTKVLDRMLQKIILGVSTGSQLSVMLMVIPFSYAAFKTGNLRNLALNQGVAFKEMGDVRIIGDIMMSALVFWAMALSVVYIQKNAMKKLSKAITQYARSWREYGDKKRQRARVQQDLSKALRSWYELFGPFVESILSRFTNDPKKYLLFKEALKLEEKDRIRKVGKRFSSRKKKQSKSKDTTEKEKDKSSRGETLLNMVSMYNCMSEKTDDAVNECLRRHGLLKDDNFAKPMTPRHRRSDNGLGRYRNEVKVEPKEVKVERKEGDEYLIPEGMPKEKTHATRTFLESNLHDSEKIANDWHVVQCTDEEPDTYKIYWHVSGFSYHKDIPNDVIYMYNNKPYQLTIDQFRQGYLIKEGDYIFRTGNKYTRLGKKDNRYKNNAFEINKCNM